MEIYRKFVQAVRPAREYVAAFFRWSLLGAVVGLAGGAVGAALFEGRGVRNRAAR